MAETVKHTPGPWTYYADVPSTEPNWHIVTTENKRRVLANVHIEPGNAMDEANARLISAAPAMLAALQLALARMEGGHMDKRGNYTANFHDDDVEPIRAAIAKAEGWS